MERSERREEIKLLLEYTKLVVSLVAAGSLLFAGLQWMDSNRVTDEAMYQRMATEWRDHLKMFVEKPNLRPYFESYKSLGADDANRDAVLALADVRLETMDAILTYAALRFPRLNIQGWRNTFANAFHVSPVLCARQMKETNGPPGVQAVALAVLASLAGFCAAGSFLTQGFTWPIYVIVALNAAVVRFVSAGWAPERSSPTPDSGAVES